MTIEVLDSHTEGEPTRTVVAGGPDLGNGSMAQRAAVFREHFDHFRSAVVNEPRGWDALVGALLVEPEDPACAAGVIFFNNVGLLGMCVHGAIGLVVTQAERGRLQPGRHGIETPVGRVDAVLTERGEVCVENVFSYRHRRAVPVEVPGFGRMHGDVAWGGNWFFLVDDHAHRVAADNIEALTACALGIRRALEKGGITGGNGHVIDHIELFGPPEIPGADSKNFVLCPGAAYDRSPCGTGTSAKLACLHADGKLAGGQVWVQESIIGSTFRGSILERDGGVIPRITGRAYVTAKARLILDPADPFRDGIRSPLPTGP